MTESTQTLTGKLRYQWLPAFYAHRYDGNVAQRVVGKAILAGKLTRLGGSRRGRARLAGLPFFLTLRRRIRGLRDRQVTVDVSWRGQPLSFRVSDRSELEVLREIFSEEEYDFAKVTDPRTIVDLGSNIGASIHYLHGRYPHARLIAVEASPRTAEKLGANVAPLPNVETVVRAVAGDSGQRAFVRHESSWASGFATGEGDVETVEASTLENLLDELGIDRVDLLKIDVEGAEWEVFEAYAAHGRLGEVIGEYHEDITGHPTSEFAALFPRHTLEFWGEGPDYTFRAQPREPMEGAHPR